MLRIVVVDMMEAPITIDATNMTVLIAIIQLVVGGTVGVVVITIDHTMITVVLIVKDAMNMIVCIVTTHHAMACKRDVIVMVKWTAAAHFATKFPYQIFAKLLSNFLHNSFSIT